MIWYLFWFDIYLSKIFNLSSFFNLGVRVIPLFYFIKKILVRQKHPWVNQTFMYSARNAPTLSKNLKDPVIWSAIIQNSMFPKPSNMPKNVRSVGKCLVKSTCENTSKNAIRSFKPYRYVKFRKYCRKSESNEYQDKQWRWKSKISKSVRNKLESDTVIFLSSRTAKLKGSKLIC